ncbi:MAG: peptidoglycan-binding protein [Chthoniobacterales bacterium]|nr:peptidoglycan-binding protein [Chthoniobacterales bacterium]
MKRFFFVFAAIGLCGLGSALADESVQAAQTRLKEGGFYFGNATGMYDSATAAAVTRYQIRHGLAISGKLDAATAQALGLAATKTAETEPSPTSDTWRQLRNEDMQFLKALNSGAIPPPRAPTSSTPAPSPASVAKKAQRAPQAPPPRVADSRPNVTREEAAIPAERPLSPDASASRERLRDYVGAFVLAGLDPRVGAELEFFGERVDYFGERNFDRARIQRDLLRYEARWPERRFWLAGDLRVEQERGVGLKVTFPLRYELRRGSKHASGQVWKTLTLRKTGSDDFEIVAVNERKRSFTR